MTREEARQIIAIWLVSSKGTKEQRGYIEGWFDEEDVEAFRMAIEALDISTNTPTKSTNTPTNTPTDASADRPSDEEDQLKFYYVESIDDYWIGMRIDNFYYADWHERLGFVWSKSRYLPWGEHIVDENTLWKEHTYPSEPIEIPFTEWIVGFVKKYSAETDIVRCKECKYRDPENKHCDCGAIERQGCKFPVNDEYSCSYGERREE